MEDYEINRTARRENLVEKLGYLDTMYADILRGLDMINPKGDNEATVRTAIASAKAAIVQHFTEVLSYLVAVGAAMGVVSEEMPPLDKRTLN